MTQKHTTTLRQKALIHPTVRQAKSKPMCPAAIRKSTTGFYGAVCHVSTAMRMNAGTKITEAMRMN